MKKSYYHGILMVFGMVITMAASLSIYFISGPKIVPLFGLTGILHSIVLYLVWPAVGGYIGTVVGTRVLTPLFLRIKEKVLMRKYITAYTDSTKDCESTALVASATAKKFDANRSSKPKKKGTTAKPKKSAGTNDVGIIRLPFRAKIFLGRMIKTVLFTIGLYTLIEPLNLIDLRMFMLSWSSEHYVPHQFDSQAYSGFISLLTPFTFGISSIVWSLQDASIIHYSLPPSQKKSPFFLHEFEIEPVYVRFKSYIDGFSGISSIYYYIQAVYWNLTNPEAELVWRIVTPLMMATLVFMMGFMLFPAYLGYLSLDKSFLIKKLPRRRILTKAEYEGESDKSID